MAGEIERDLSRPDDRDTIPRIGKQKPRRFSPSVNSDVVWNGLWQHQEDT